MNKLLFITPGFPKDETESHVIPFLQHFFLAFKKQYPEIVITIISIHVPLGSDYYWNGIKVIPLSGNNVRYPSKIVFYIKSFLKIISLLNKNKYDGILNFWYNDFSVFSHFIFPKTYTWMLGQDVKKDNLYLRFFKPNPKKIMTLSQFNDDVLFENKKIRAHKIIPMGINEDLFPPLNENKRKIDVFGAGNLTSLKNYRLFVNAILELKITNPTIIAEIAGTGEEEFELKKMIHDNKLENNLTLIGQLSHQETIEKMNNTAIFLHTSTFEGGSTVYFEALYSGCQLVGTLQMMDKPIENFHYHTTKKSIANCITSLLQNPKPVKRISYYPMSHICKEIYELYYKN